jgi:hypothetical protein
MVTGDALKELRGRFYGRLAEAELKFALDYVDFNEEPLALETLCDYLCENNVAITQDEFNDILKLDEVTGSNLDARVIRYIKKLIQ